MIINLAGPLFTLAERMFNDDWAYELLKQSSSLEIYLPQQQAMKLADEADFSTKMFNYSFAAIDASDAVVGWVAQLLIPFRQCHPPGSTPLAGINGSWHLYSLPLFTFGGSSF